MTTYIYIYYITETPEYLLFTKCVSVTVVFTAGMNYQTIFVPRGLLLPSDTSQNQTPTNIHFLQSPSQSYSNHCVPTLLSPTRHVPCFTTWASHHVTRTSVVLANHTASASGQKERASRSYPYIYTTPPLCDLVCPDTNVSFRASADYISHLYPTFPLPNQLCIHISLILLTIYIT